MTEKEWLNIGYQSNVIDVITDDVMTFREVYKQWFLYKRGQIKPQSLDRIENSWMRFYESSPIACEKINNIDEQYVIDFLNSAFAKYGSMTVKQYQKLFQIVTSVLTYALDFGFPGSRLLNWTKIKNYTYTNHIVSAKRDTDCIRDADIRRLHDFVLSSGYPQKQSQCLLLMFNFYTGLRIGELAALCWHDIDFDKKLLRVSRSMVKKYERDSDGMRNGALQYVVGDEPKTVNGIRTIPLCDKAMVFLRLLRMHHDRMNYNSSFLHYDGKETVAVRSLERCLARLCQLADVPVFNTHMIRKTVATKLHYKGVPTRMISDFLGHAEVSTTEKCYILTDSAYAENVSHQLNEAFDY